MSHRVVVTGTGAVSPVGGTLEESANAVRLGHTGVVHMPEWAAVGGLETRLGAPVAAPNLEGLPRKAARTMGRVSQLATVATGQAIADAGLTVEELHSGRVGLAYGSTAGSSEAHEEWVRRLYATRSVIGLASTSYLKFMSHTAAANLAIHFGVRGRVMSTCSACVSASQAIGFAYEAIRYGTAEVMIAGGAEELHFSHAVVFDIMHATSSKYNETPNDAPRPFDRARDGLVVGEGAGTFVLENYDRAKRLGKTIYAEVIGFGTNCDSNHVTTPSSDGMRGAMMCALEDARISASDIGYVNAHATATLIGDVAEAAATYELFGGNTPVSSLKGHMGHTLGACGAIEAGIGIRMLREGWIAPTRNLTEVDPACAALDFVMGAPREQRISTFMSNKFAFGGINTSLIFRAV